MKALLTSLAVYGLVFALAQPGRAPKNCDEFEELP
jgi:hypothetical protein